MSLFLWPVVMVPVPGIRTTKQDAVQGKSDIGYIEYYIEYEFPENLFMIPGNNFRYPEASHFWNAGDELVESVEFLTPAGTCLAWKFFTG